MVATSSALSELTEAGDPRLVVDALKQAGVDVVAVLPDRKLARLHDLLESDPFFTTITVCREEEGIGICTGAFYGGHRAALLMQNGGLFVATNALVSTAIMYEIPMLLLIYYAGDINDRYFPTVGHYTEPILQALSIRYYLPREPQQVRPTIAGAQVLANDSMRPVAVLLTKPVLGEEGTGL
jgi:sulfopyruvate decarboxylase subunit alpha